MADGDQIGLFLGAGASFELGMPLAWDVTGEIRNWLTPDKLRQLNQGWELQGGGFPAALVDEIAGMLTDPSTHYEAKLGYLETQFSRGGPFAEKYHHFYSWLVELVWMLLYYRHEHGLPYIERGVRFYAGLAGLADRCRPLWVFSLNHDLMVECIAAAFEVPVSVGLSELSSLPLRSRESGQIIGRLPVEMRSVEDIEKEAFQFARQGERCINLMKVHGALDLFAADDRKQLVRLLPSAPSVAGVLASLRSAHENLLYLSGEPRMKATNEIMYADDRGEMQFLRRSLLAGAYKFDEHCDQVLPKVMLSQFRAHLNYVRELVCLGYGFGDQHINQVLRAWLEFKGERRIIVVAPDARVPDFLGHLRLQVSCEPVTATRFLERYATQPLGLVDQAFREVRSWVRTERRRSRGFA